MMIGTTMFSLIVLIVIYTAAAKRQHADIETDLDGNSKNAMESIYRVNAQMNEYAASEMIDMDERFEYEAPNNVPEGVQFGLLKKQHGRVWKDAIVYFRISNDYNAQQKETIREATRNIERGTCIRFKELFRDDPNTHHIHIVNKEGCWSFVGKALGRQNQELSLSIPGCVHASVATHELVHSLGVFHEQARPDRDQYVEIHPENMLPNALKQFAKKDSIDSLGIPYDGESIMHYSSFAFSNRRGPSITWKGNPRKKLGGGVLSKSDIKQLNLLYECKNKAPLTTMLRSLQTTRRPTPTPRPTRSTRRPIRSTRRPIRFTRKPTRTTRRPTPTPRPTRSTRRPIRSTRRPIRTTQRPMPTPRPTRSTRRPIRSTRRPTTKRQTSNECREANWCSFVYDLGNSCRSAAIQISCPSSCNRCSTEPKYVKITKRKTTTTTATTTTTRRPVITKRKYTNRGCFDVSSHCSSSSGFCHLDIYKRRCRKSCGQCSQPLPAECKWHRDQIPNCPQTTRYGCYGIAHWQKIMCGLSCCLRNEL